MDDKSLNYKSKVIKHVIEGIKALHRKFLLITPCDREFSNGKKAAILKIFLNKTFGFTFF